MGILGRADLTLTSLDPDSPAHDDVKQMELAARRAADLTRQMLAYSGNLVVDDDENVRTVAERMLRRTGHDVVTATDGREGVRVVRERGSD